MLPTALQVHRNHVILFHEGGASKLTQHEELGPYGVLKPASSTPPERIWALVDTNRNLLGPAPAIAEKSRFFVVNAVSVGSGQLEWVKKVVSARFYMAPWPVAEILQAYVDSLLGLHNVHDFLQSLALWPHWASTQIFV
jgi:hypothetical protein